MFYNEIADIISNTDSCFGFLRERGVLRAMPPFCPKCNKRATEVKDSGKGEKPLNYSPDIWMHICGGRDTAKPDQLPLTTFYYTSQRLTQKIAKISQIYNFFQFLYKKYIVQILLIF